jgi:hypothetical protein
LPEPISKEPETFANEIANCRLLFLGQFPQLAPRCADLNRSHFQDSVPVRAPITPIFAVEAMPIP